MSFRVRPAKAEDIGFVCDAWRESFRHTSLVHKASGYEAYKRFMAALLGKVLKNASALVACHPDDEDALLGFVVHEGPELHYVYVRGGENPAESLRHHGIARALVEPLGITSYTFDTKAGASRLKPEERGWRFSPRFTA